MSHTSHSLIRKQFLIFVALTVFGLLALLLGLSLIIFVHYHERAYVFLALGAGGFISGIAGIFKAESKVKMLLSYGLIAMGMMGIVVGFNYLIDRYGGAPNQMHGYIVITLSVIVILLGIVGALITQPRGGITAFLSVTIQGVIASIGIVTLTVGTIYMVVLQSHEHAFLLFGIGVGCLLCSVAYGIFTQIE